MPAPRLAVLLTVVAILLTGCRAQSSLSAPLEERLKEKVAAFYRAEASDVADLAVIGQTSSPKLHMVGYRFSLGSRVILGANQIDTKSGKILGGFYHPLSKRSDAISLYGGSSEGDPPFSLFYGRVWDPRIGTVQVETTSGEVMDIPVRDEYFFAVLPKLTEWQSIRGLDMEGAEVYRSDRDSD